MAKNSLQNQALLKELEQWLTDNGLTFETEQTFSQFMQTKRRFRADYLIGNRIILEVNGGHWTFGRHNRGKGYENDLIKSNMAQVNGFIFLQYTYGQLKERLYIADLKELIQA